MIYALDTDHISILQRGGLGSVLLVERLQRLPADDLGTTIVSYEEQCRGLADEIHQARNAHQRLEAYDQLSRNLRFFCSIAVWEFTQEAETHYAALLKAKLRVGTNDLKIASITMANGATVLTRNTRDFSRIPGVLHADWTV